MSTEAAPQTTVRALVLTGPAHDLSRSWHVLADDVDALVGRSEQDAIALHTLFADDFGDGGELLIGSSAPRPEIEQRFQQLAQVDPDYVRVQVLTPIRTLDRDKQPGVVKELTEIVAAAAGDPTQAERTWVLLTESPEGGWGMAGHAYRSDEIVAAARAQLGTEVEPS